MILVRLTMFACSVSRRRSRKRYLQANVFRIVRLAEHRQRQFLGRAQNFDLLVKSSTSPVGRLALSVSAVRALTSPSTRMTHSARTSSAALKNKDNDRTKEPSYI